MNLYDIIGPVMVGPSSSHTAGAVRIGYISGKLLDEPVKSAKILLYGSFLATGTGHGTRKALVAGLLGMKPDDTRIPDSLTIAAEQGIEIIFGEAQLKEAHPNSAELILQGVSGKTLEIVGESLGGSRINIARIDGIATNFSGDYASLVMEKAVKMGESNACIAGASGGCQAEIGSASAMAAAGLAYLQGGDNDMIVNAMTLALKNMLGLTCDPVCGLVEVPCIKRNSAGAINAVASAQLSLAGIKSAIPADEVIDSMRRIGNDMPKCLKETGEGGLAVTETAQKLRAYQGSSEK